jgi:hypothetical protein
MYPYYYYLAGVGYIRNAIPRNSTLARPFLFVTQPSASGIHVITKIHFGGDGRTR